jgi:hypothetical protein
MLHKSQLVIRIFFVGIQRKIESTTEVSTGKPIDSISWKPSTVCYVDYGEKKVYSQETCGAK